MAKRLDKPVRLYVLAILIVAAYGLMPFVSAFVAGREVWLVGLHHLPLNGSIFVLYDADGNADIILVFVSLLLCVGSAASAIWAFYDLATARAVTLGFVTLDVIWWMGIAAYAIVFSETDPGAKLKWALELIGPPIWLALIWWNFMRPDIDAYYKFRSMADRSGNHA